MADPIGIFKSLIGIKTSTPTTPTPAAAPQSPATAPSGAGGRQSFLSSAAAIPAQQNIGSKTLLGQ